MAEFFFHNYDTKTHILKNLLEVSWVCLNGILSFDTVHLSSNIRQLVRNSLLPSFSQIWDESWFLHKNSMIVVWGGPKYTCIGYSSLSSPRELLIENRYQNALQMVIWLHFMSNYILYETNFSTGLVMKISKFFPHATCTTFLQF